MHVIGFASLESYFSINRAGVRELFRFKTNGDGAENYTYDILKRLVEALNPLPSSP